MEFKDFSRTSPKIQGRFKTVRTLLFLKPSQSSISKITKTWKNKQTGQINKQTN